MKKCYKCKNLIQTNECYGLHERCFIEWFKLEQAQEFQNLDPKKNSNQLHHNEIKKNRDTFFHGRYLKYSAQLGKVSYILKLQESDCPELPGVEYVCNEIASILSIAVPDYYLIDFNSHTTFVTRNFTQDYQGTLHHIYKFLPDGDENYNCENIIKIILAQTGKLKDVMNFIEICLFDALIGNNDRHGRNLGLIATSNMMRLAPMYDNPSYLGIVDEALLGAHFNPSGCVWTKKTNEPKVKDYLEEFERLGFKIKVDMMSKTIVQKEHEIMKLLGDAPVENRRKEAFIKLVKTRLEEFRNA
jgi:hypothetical protein